MAAVGTQPLIVIVGPTASGKTSLAIELAREFDGEIICADSRTVYVGMDIGTAKPTVQERAAVPHWGLDLVRPGERFSAADFKAYANQKIEEIRRRGKVPFLVGGTGLYVDSVILDYQFTQRSDESERQRLEAMTLDALVDYCLKNNIELPENSKNKRYVVRAIEQKSINSKRRTAPIDNCYVVGIATDRTILRTRIVDRSEHIVTQSVVEEATLLANEYGWESEAMTGNIYPLVKLYLEGVITQQEMKDKFTTLDWRLAKRQLTWLRRHNFVHWQDVTGARTYLQAILARA